MIILCAVRIINPQMRPKQPSAQRTTNALTFSAHLVNKSTVGT